MYKEILSPSDMLAWAYEYVDKRKSEFPSGQNILAYRSTITILANTYKSNFMEFKNELKNQYDLEDLKQKKDEDFFLALMTVVADKFSQEYELSSIELPQIRKKDTLEPLNKLYCDKYLVYPKFQDSFIQIINHLFKFGLRKISYMNPINAILDKYIIVKMTETKHFKYRYITYRDPKYLSTLVQDKKIAFTFVPFIIDKIDQYFNIEENQKSGFFSVLGPLNKEKDNELFERYKNTLKNIYSTGQYPEFVIFPEMILTKRIVESLPQMIKDLNLEKSSLILAGTLWDQGRNVAYLYNHRGHLIIKQEKYYAFDYEKPGYKIVERINVDKEQHVLNILDIGIIGKIAIFICKDIKSEEYLNMLKLLNVDIVIVPSYSDSNDVLSQMENMAENHHCTTVFLNACSSKKDDIGRIILPTLKSNGVSKNKTVRASKVVPITKKMCISCYSQCDGIDFVLDIEKELK